MAASFAAMGAVVISDLAYAGEDVRVLEADDVPSAPAVKISKLEARPQLVIPEAVDLPNFRTSKKKVNFGQFEGY